MKDLLEIREMMIGEPSSYQDGTVYELEGQWVYKIGDKVYGFLTKEDAETSLKNYEQNTQVGSV